MSPFLIFTCFAAFPPGISAVYSIFWHLSKNHRLALRYFRRGQAIQTRD
jgi:hypothetical protein